MSCVVCTRHQPAQDGDCTTMCQHRRKDVGDLCGPCAQHIRDNLDAIAAAMHISAMPTAGASKGNERPLPGGLEVLDYRYGGELLGCLNDWVRVWHEDMTTPTSAPAMPPCTVVEMCKWLRAMLETFGCTHEAIKEFSEDIEPWAARARRITGDIPQGHLLPCPCGRRLRVESADMDAKVRCRACGNVWTTRSLTINAGEDDSWVDWQVIEDHLGVPRSTLYRWATQGKVEKRHGLFKIGDVKAVARGA